MMKIIKANKNGLKQLTFLLDLITPVILLLTIKSGNQTINSGIFLIMVIIRVLFVLS